MSKPAGDFGLPRPLRGERKRKGGDIRNFRTPTLLATKEVGELFGVTPHCIREWARSGQIHSHQSGEGKFHWFEVGRILEELIHTRRKPQDSLNKLIPCMRVWELEKHHDLLFSYLMGDLEGAG